MVKLQLIVGLCVLVMGVQALDQAVPYELLYFYSVYKMEYRAVDKNSRTIATGCVHNAKKSPAGLAFETAAAAAGVPDICTFDEFVKEVGSKGSLGKLTWSDDGRSLTPDPDKMASRIIKIANSNKKHLLYWPSKLLPKAGFPTGSGSAIVEVPLPDLLQGVLDAAQNARREASAVGGDVASFVNSCLTDAKNFLRIGNQFRLSDQTAYFNKDYLSGLPEGAPFAPFFQDKPQVITKVDGKTPITDTDFPLASYDAIDWDKTWLDSQASTTPEQRAALEQVVEAYGHSTAPEDAVAKIHQDVLVMQTFSTDLLSGNNLACKILPKKRDITLMEKRKLMDLVRRHGF